MRKLSMNQKLGSMLLVLWIGLILISLLGAWQTRRSIIEDRQEKLVFAAEQALSIANYYADAARKNRLGEGEAKQKTLEMLAALRYGKEGYFSVSDAQVVTLMHPFKPELVGKNMGGFVDIQGQHLFADFVRVGAQPGGGFVSYLWPKPGHDSPVPKISYAIRFEPWNWCLTTGVYMDDIDRDFRLALLRWLACTALLGTLSTVVMMLVLRSVRKSIGGPLESAIEMAHRIAQGDLTGVVHEKLDGDHSSLMHALTTMQDGLVSLVSFVRSGTEMINIGAKEIAASSADLSERTENQAAALAQTASSMNQMTSTVRLNADSAAHAERLSEEAAEVAQLGRNVVVEVVRTMSNIVASSHKIADIIGVIDGIAFQTNLLALNAAVEAARAGDHGRGFAVVATEVRNLSMRTAAAAKDIKALIESSTQTVESGASQASNAGDTMEEIVRSARRVNKILDEIKTVSQEQSAGIEGVNATIEQMDFFTQENAALVEEASAAAISLRDQVGGLRQAISNFALPA